MRHGLCFFREPPFPRSILNYVCPVALVHRQQPTRPQLLQLSRVCLLHGASNTSYLSCSPGSRCHAGHGMKNIKGGKEGFYRWSRRYYAGCLNLDGCQIQQQQRRNCGYACGPANLNSPHFRHLLIEGHHHLFVLGHSSTYVNVFHS